MYVRWSRKKEGEPNRDFHLQFSQLWDFHLWDLHVHFSQLWETFLWRLFVFFHPVGQAPHPKDPRQFIFHKSLQASFSNISICPICSHANQKLSCFWINCCNAKPGQCTFCTVKNSSTVPTSGLAGEKKLILLWTFSSIPPTYTLHHKTTKTSSFTLPASVDPSINSEKNFALARQVAKPSVRVSAM